MPILIAEFELVKALPVTNYRQLAEGIAPPDDDEEKAESEGKGENEGVSCLWCCNSEGGWWFNCSLEGT